MSEKLEVEVERLKEFISKKPLLNKLFEDEIRNAVKENMTKRGWMIFVTGLVFGLMIGYTVNMLLV